MKKFNIIALLNCKFFEKNGYFLLSYFKIYRLSVFFMYSSMFKGICLRDIRRVDKPGKKFRFGLTYI